MRIGPIFFIFLTLNPFLCQSGSLVQTQALMDHRPEGPSPPLSARRQSDTSRSAAVVSQTCQEIFSNTVIPEFFATQVPEVPAKCKH